MTKDELMTTETLENGDYITCERSAYPNGAWGARNKRIIYEI